MIKTAQIFLIVMTLLAASSLQMQAQSLRFEFILEGEPLTLSEKSSVSSIANRTVSACRFYISDLVFLHNKDTVAKDKTVYHLIDAEKVESCSIATTNIPEYNSICFKLGIDSITSTSGVFGGALDPTNGMYWTWQSGYINFKLEGSFKGKDYSYHLGGYLSSESAWQNVTLPVKSGNSTITVDLSVFFKATPETVHSIMSPSPEAVRLSKAAADMFSLKK
jgi:hypothetical protein